MPRMWKGAYIKDKPGKSHAKAYWRKTHQVRAICEIEKLISILHFNLSTRCPYCPWVGQSSSELNKHKIGQHKLEREREKMKKRLFHAGHNIQDSGIFDNVP